MIDHATIEKLADLRRQIDGARDTAGKTLDAMSRARGNAAAAAEATPFLSDCAKELEALAGVVRLAAAEAGDRSAA